jgi:hypothetical protein
MKRVIKFAAVALILVIAISVAVSAGSKKTAGSTQSPALVTSAATQTATAAPVIHRAPARPQRFVGNGAENLGTIVVPVDSTLTWRCASCTETGMQIISVSDSYNTINVLQRATSGKSAVSADTYKNVSVNADGPFTITITPGA